MTDQVGDVYIPKDHRTRESRGFAFVRFYDKRDAEDAMEALDGRQYDGRELRVEIAKVCFTFKGRIQKNKPKMQCYSFNF